MYLAIKHLLVHDALVLDNTQTPIIVVTGRNGSGKSLLIDAYSTALWGKTHRGIIPWTDTQRSELRVRVNNTQVTRVRVGNRSVVAVNGTEYETATKAQEAIAAVFGSFESWLHGHVFSVRNNTKLGAASDTELKSLFESVAFETDFDTAMSRCKADVQAIFVQHTNTQTKLEQYRNELTWLNGTAPESPDALLQVRDTVHEQIKTLKDQHSEALAQVTQAQWRYSYLQAQFVQLTERLKSATARTCAQCGQSISPSQLNVSELEAERVLLQEDISSVRSSVEQAQRQATEYQATLTRLQQERATVDSKLEFSARFQTRVRECASNVQANSELLTNLDSRLAVGRAIESVLGPRGVRAQLLRDFVAMFQSISNKYLSALFTESVSLMATVDERIELKVSNIALGRGYKAMSSGQQRRVDIALMLAFSDLCHSAHDTLWFDEVFDTLDHEGTERVCALMGDLTKRAIIITHNHHVADVLVKRFGAQHIALK